MFKKLFLVVLFGISLNALSHEGHENTPGTLKSNHGGVVKAGKQVNLEYVISGSEVKLFPVSHEGKDLLATDVKMTATVTIPKGRAENIQLENKDGSFVAHVNFKNAYRVEMNVSVDEQGKVSIFKFQVEK